MKFCKKYQEYMQKQEQKQLPGVGFKNLKKILRNCRHDELRKEDIPAAVVGSSISACPQQCRVCEGTFFPSLLKEMSEVLACFSEQSQKLLEIHLAKGLRRYYLRWKWKQHKDHASLVQEGQELVTYAMINATAVKKILKKYDKIHSCNQGQKFKSRMQRSHVDILKSPWLCELMALQMNLEKKPNTRQSTVFFQGCCLTFTDGKPSLSCELFDSIKIDVDLTCSICLDTLFDAVSLSCGHMLCYMCACSAASVSIVDGLEAADHDQRCPLCREQGVYGGFVHLTELNILLSHKCPEYWQERLQSERCERLQRTKEHYESMFRAFAL